MNQTTYLRTKEGTKLFDTTSRVFNRIFNIWSKVTFTREEARIFEGNKFIINEINELILDYQFGLSTAIQYYSKIWFETDENNQRYIQYIELFVYFDNVDLKNREKFIYRQIIYMRRIIAAIESFKYSKTGRLRTNLNMFTDSYTVTTNIYLSIEETSKMKTSERLRYNVNTVIDMYKANSKDALINYSTVLYWAPSNLAYYYAKISLKTSYKIEDIKRRIANISIQRKYARKILGQIKASMSAQSHAKQLIIKIIIKMKILKNTKDGLVVVIAIAISDNLAEKFENCSSYKNKSILKECPSFSSFEIKDNPCGDKGFRKMAVVTAQEIKATDLEEIDELAEMQDKAVKAILKREATSLILAGLNADITGQYIKIHDINKAIYGSETEEN